MHFVCKKFRQLSPVVCVDICSFYYLLCSVLGTKSKASIESIVARSVHCAGFGDLRP